MNQKCTQQEETLLQIVNQKNYKKILVQNSIYSIISHTLPVACQILQIRLLFLTFGQQYTQIYSRLFIFEELFTHAVPLSLSFSAALSAQLYFGQSLSNISQTQVTHFFMILLVFQLLLICFVIISISIDPAFITNKFSLQLLFVEQDDVKIVSRFILVKLCCEPILFALSRLSVVFMIAEGRTEISCIFTIFYSVFELICVCLCFLINYNSLNNHKIFDHIAYAQLIAKVIFAIIYLSILTVFKDNRRNQFIYFQLQKRYFFPINWTTIYRMFVTSIPLFLTFSSPFIFSIIAFQFKFSVNNISDIMNSLNLFSLVLVYLFSSSIQGILNASCTFHAYFIGRNDLSKARETAFFVFRCLLIWLLILIITLIISKLKVQTFFSDTQFNINSIAVTSQDYMIIIYGVIISLTFQLLGIYLLAVKFYWILGAIVTALSYAIGTYSIIVTNSYAQYSPDLIMISLLPYLSMGLGGICIIVGFTFHERKQIIQFGNSFKALKND
ncbi:Transmembrane domain-containing protein [Spironucleus salmonicida]|uniref:Transmembrane domain-containing protein n=1 Tax=Spironucleus salmonicida TaxID=348837 RepID=V6LC98_9EUKA|nr:Transmembrane domain-containing protein [Spironucleus salmonicida]|eukprot:EST42130.1 Transmembrane domain-containing protein [Spironucleus salmonicida]